MAGAPCDASQCKMTIETFKTVVQTTAKKASGLKIREREKQRGVCKL